MNDDRLLTSAEVQRILAVSSKWLNQLRRDRKIPFVRLGYRSMRFRQQDVARFISRRRRTGNTEFLLGRSVVTDQTASRAAEMTGRKDGETRSRGG